MVESGSGPTLSSHEILRFSAAHFVMCLRHVALHNDRVIISLRDHTAQGNLWEIAQVGGQVGEQAEDRTRPR